MKNGWRIIGFLVLATVLAVPSAYARKKDGKDWGLKEMFFKKPTLRW